MKLIISGKVYELSDALENSTLNDVYAMTIQSGVGIGTLQKKLKEIEDLPVEEAMDDPATLRVFRAMIFLVRRYAGEELTVDQACAFPMSSMEFVDDEEDDADADPTSPPTDSVPAVGAKGSRSTSPTTRTSKARSGATS